MHENIKSTISTYNQKLLSNDPPTADQCNCERMTTKRKVPDKSVVYKAEIKSENNGAVKTYIVMTAKPSKRDTGGM